MTKGEFTSEERADLLDALVAAIQDRDEYQRRHSFDTDYSPEEAQTLRQQLDRWELLRDRLVEEGVKA